MEPLDYCLDLMRRLSPLKVEENLQHLIGLVPDLTDDLLSSVDQPLKVKQCGKTGKDYVICDYNRDGESYRSPWSNEYHPHIQGLQPSQKLRCIEIAANDAFDAYRELYYEGGVSSVYCWDLDNGFACVVLIKKVNNGQGGWDSIHVFEVHDKTKSAHYKLTSTVMLHMDAGSTIPMNLSGNLTRQMEQECAVPDCNAHVTNMGRMVEEMESKLRNALQEIYFGKTKDIVNDLRSATSLKQVRQQATMQAEIVDKLKFK